MHSILPIFLYSDLRSSTNRKHFLAFVYVWNGAFVVGNVECYRSANAAAILGVTVMFWHGKLHTLVIQNTTLLVLCLRT